MASYTAAACTAAVSGTAASSSAAVCTAAVSYTAANGSVAVSSAAANSHPATTVSTAADSLVSTAQPKMEACMDMHNHSAPESSHGVGVTTAMKRSRQAQIS